MPLARASTNFLAVYAPVYGISGAITDLFPTRKLCRTLLYCSPLCFSMASVERLTAQLEDPSTPISKKHRVLFALKNMDTPDAHAAMLLGLRDASVLFRHEVAYCLGICVSFKA